MLFLVLRTSFIHVRFRFVVLFWVLVSSSLPHPTFRFTPLVFCLCSFSCEFLIVRVGLLPSPLLCVTVLVCICFGCAGGAFSVTVMKVRLQHFRMFQSVYIFSLHSLCSFFAAWCCVRVCCSFFSLPLLSAFIFVPPLPIGWPFSM